MATRGERPIRRVQFFVGLYPFSFHSIEVPFVHLGVHDPLCDELHAAFSRVLQSGRFILGPELSAFEAQ